MSLEPIAIVGLGGVLPGAFSLDQFWRNLVELRDCAQVVPAGRWVIDPERAHAQPAGFDQVLSRRGCFVPEFELDRDGLDLEWSALGELDPLYKMALQASREAWRDQRSWTSVERSRVGVILAAIALPTDGSSAATWDYFRPQVLEKLRRLRPHWNLPPAQRNPGSPFNLQVTGLPASIVARALGLGGGSYTLDAACASSLYALKLACDELRSGRADAMLAGGVSRPDCLYTQMGFTALGALSPSGRCSPFDVQGDGLVVGEGAGVLVLKRLSTALQQGDHIYGLLRHIGLSNDIGGSLLAPDTEGQLRAMHAAYGGAGWNPEAVDIVECHGTGTPMGDRIEVKSLRALWKDRPHQEGQCPIGSVKSAIGHLLTGAGAAGMLKILLGMRHQTLPPSLNFTAPNANIPLPGSPFRVITRPEPWQRRSESRKAAVSAFGFGGINAHVLVEEHLPERRSWPVSAPPPAQPIAIVGIAAQVGSAHDVESFVDSLFAGQTLLRPAPQSRWKGRPVETLGAFLDSYEMAIGGYKVPPRDVPSLLPQQTLMLKVAAQAAQDAGLERAGRYERGSAIIGISLDMDTTDYHMRWALPAQLEEWCRAAGQPFSEELLQDLRDYASAPLDSTRTLGALGSIVASRIARELNLGGPSFAVSAQEASGNKALEIACRALQQGELDQALVGAIDLAGDPRLLEASLQPKGQPHPFDSRSQGSQPGEGAVALVLKRLSDCAPDEKVYAVIHALGSASGGGMEVPQPSPEAQGQAVLRAYQEAGWHPSQISHVEAALAGQGAQLDLQQLAVLAGWYGEGQQPCSLGAQSQHSGHCGAASGLLGLAKTALCLYHQQLPPLRGFVEPLADLKQTRLHIPIQTSWWLRDAGNGPRRAALHTASSDGNCSHILLEQPYSTPTPSGVRLVRLDEESGSLGDPAHYSNHRGAALFCLAADSLQGLLEQGRQLAALQADELHQLAELWWHQSPPQGSQRAAIVATSRDELEQTLASLSKLLGSPCPGHAGLFYNPQPLRSGEVAFVFPGSGNHYAGMGRELGVLFPHILHRLDLESRELAQHIQAPWSVPYRSEWRDGWEAEGSQAIASDLHRAIFGQVMVDMLNSDLLRELGVEPQAAIGYSLGESAALIALRAWYRRHEIYRKMTASSIFHEDLGGPCNAPRRVFGIPLDDPDWKWAVVLLNQPASVVRPLLAKYRDAELMIVNTDGECVVGGGLVSLQALAQEVGGTVFFLEGIPAVHCRVLEPVLEQYRDLHWLDTQAPAGLRFYSAYSAESYIPTQERACRAITEQALYGLDFTRVIRQAYQDGVRFFVEVGPGRSCSRMISQILKGHPHFTRAVNARTESEYFGLLKLLAQLYSEHLPGLNLAPLYRYSRLAREAEPRPGVKVTLGEQLPAYLQEAVPARVQVAPTAAATPPPVPAAPTPSLPAPLPAPLAGPEESVEVYVDEPLDDWEWPQFLVDEDEEGELIMASTPSKGSQIPVQIIKTVQATAAAHETYLRVAQQGVEDLATALQLQNDMLQRALGGVALSQPVILNSAPSVAALPAPAAVVHTTYNPFNDENPRRIVPDKRPCVLDYDQCMEFAIGSIAKVLGGEFAAADTYPTRVRLPDDPLMLVHRVTALEGEARSLGQGRIVTEHDVQEGAWYLDNQRMPVCVTVEAGQADLFLSGYLGIDLKTLGKRVYRLLDATVSFHRRLPTVGETISYDIRIDRFVRQGETYLFFFEFDGTINGEPLITMRNGCAGFFTYEEIKANKGIILTPAELEKVPGKIAAGYRQLVSFTHKESYSDAQVNALRQGRLGDCFGPAFGQLTFNHPPRLPSGRLKLYDRILEVDPVGGRYGLGSVRAEADVHPDDWFLTCHFVDDMVMPGTLMYECCAHTLRFLLWRMGWVGEADQVTYEPLLDLPAVLRCRGPVDVHTSKVIYEVELKEIGYQTDGTPYVLADALMHANGKAIVRFVDMSLRLLGLSQQQLEQRWGLPAAAAQPPQGYRPPAHNARYGVTYDRESIMQFAYGKPSLAFGAPYEVFDDNVRRLARLPRPPFAFVDRIVELNQEPFVMQAGDWIEAQYDVPPQEWYFQANRQPSMAFAILLETALQPCGWLAAYVGSGLRSEQNLRFRNLGGKATLHRELFADSGTVRVRVRMTQVSEAGGMIIENFDMQMLDRHGMVYEGTTYFGFFTEAALANQVGIREATRYAPSPAELKRARKVALPRLHPLTPEDRQVDAGTSACMPGGAMQMLDEVDIYIPDGGAAGLGYLHGSKKVNPEEWFFQAHFYLDPVWPGSLGLEAFVQLLKVALLDKFPQLADTHRFEAIATGMEHSWIYRGQVVPKNQRVEVEAYVTEVRAGDEPVIKADGFLVVDGKPIYQMQDFAVRMVRA